MSNIDKKTLLIIKALDSLKFKNSVDDDGYIFFESESGNYYIECSNDDPDFFHLIFPAFYEIKTNAQRNKVLKACNLVNSTLKFAKFFVYNDDVYASVESFQSLNSDFEKIIERSITAIDIGLKEFSDSLDKKQD